MLVGRTCVLESKGHHLIAVQTAVGDERGMLLIRDVHGDLIVSRVDIHKVEQLVLLRSHPRADQFMEVESYPLGKPC